MPPTLCQYCGQLIGSEEEKCFSCGRSKAAQKIARFDGGAMLMPAIIILCVVLYGASLLIDTGEFRQRGGLMSIGSPDMKALYLLGMTGGSAWKSGYYWTVLSASLLHGGLLHILFNMMWLNNLSKIGSSIWGPHRMVILFVLTGVSGFVLSNVMLNAPTVGASCSIFGIMGALIVFGHRRGGEAGRSMSNQIWAWVIIGLIFGMSIPGINNYGHIGGLLGGFVVGYVFPRIERTAESVQLRWCAYGLLLLTIASVILSIINFKIYLELPLPLRR